jgi:hypothetical protein
MTDPIRIELPLGSYQPRITLRSTSEGSAALSDRPRIPERNTQEDAAHDALLAGLSGSGATRVRLAARRSTPSRWPSRSIETTRQPMRGSRGLMSGRPA